jgi:hypothetical protein
MEKCCGNCINWQGDIDKPYLDGRCNSIKSKLEANVVYGWDGGYVESYNTEVDFCCNLHKFKSR